jgi:hypothetical protein
MSFSVASYCTCSLRASSASATSVFSPIEGAPPSCPAASPLSTPLHRKTNRKPRPLLQRTRCGAVPSAADRWPSSNDSLRHNSNFVLHRSWPRPHEITRPHTALSARFRASRRSVSLLHPDIFFLSPPCLSSAIDSSLLRCAASSATGLDHSRQLLHPSLAPFNLHKVPRPPRQRLPSDGFFEHDASHFLSALSTHPGVASEKALALSGRYPQKPPFEARTLSNRDTISGKTIS